jgi:hypothetical protein
MVVSIGHTLEKEKSVGIYRCRLVEWMFKESIITNTQSRTTPPALSSSQPLTVTILVDGNIINEQLFQTSVTYTQAPHDFVVYKYLPTQVNLPLNAQSND